MAGSVNQLEPKWLRILQVCACTFWLSVAVRGACGSPLTVKLAGRTVRQLTLSASISIQANAGDGDGVIRQGRASLVAAAELPSQRALVVALELQEAAVEAAVRQVGPGGSDPVRRRQIFGTVCHPLSPTSVALPAPVLLNYTLAACWTIITSGASIGAEVSRYAFRVGRSVRFRLCGASPDNAAARVSASGTIQKRA